MNLSCSKSSQKVKVASSAAKRHTQGGTLDDAKKSCYQNGNVGGC
jgi:hypothetical protein